MTVRKLHVAAAALLAYWRLRASGNRGVLVGTAGLLLRGYDVPVPDIDFLCERPMRDELATGYGAAVSSLGVKVDYIDRVDSGRREFYHPERATRVFGVPVAAWEDIVGLKRWASRQKDRVFFEDFEG